jgi:hypothetical protein
VRQPRGRVFITQCQNQPWRRAGPCFAFSTVPRHRGAVLVWLAPWQRQESEARLMQQSSRKESNQDRLNTQPCYCRPCASQCALVHRVELSWSPEIDPDYVWHTWLCSHRNSLKTIQRHVSPSKCVVATHPRVARNVQREAPRVRCCQTRPICRWGLMRASSVSSDASEPGTVERPKSDR